MRLLRTSIYEQSGIGGYPFYRIPGIVATEKGTLLAYCEHRHGGDRSLIDVYLRRSTDGGRSWSERILLHSGCGKNTSNNPVLIVDGSRIHALTMENYKRLFHSVSEDDGCTWTEPVEISDALEELRSVYPWTVAAAGPGHGTVLQGGRLLTAVWFASNLEQIHEHAPSVTATLYSDDHGKSWHMGEILPIDYAPNPNESTVAALPDGRALISVRNMSEKRMRIVGTSPNGAGDWELAFSEALPDPICMGGLCEAPGCVLHTNCANGENRDRIRLTLRKAAVPFAGSMPCWSESLCYSESGGYSDVCWNPVTKTAFVLYETDDCRFLRLAEFEI